MSIDWSQLVQVIEQHQTFVITSHLRPDADALGSELALCSLLLSRGKSVAIINPGATPPHLQFLDPEERVLAVHQKPELVGLIAQCDVHIVVDTSAWGQLGDVGRLLAKSDSQKVVIDHHVSADDLGGIEFKDTSSPATGCLIAEFMESIGYQPSAWEAECLYTAIVTDTGWFRFPATTPQTMQIAARLMAAGAEPARLYQQLYEQASLSRVHLSGMALQRVQTVCDGKLAFTYVTLHDFATTKAHPVDTENLVNECMRLKGTVAAFILVEQNNRQFKASLRSRAEFDVTPIAETFGGGGHRQASGAMVPGPLEKAIEQVTSLFAQAFAGTLPSATSPSA